MAVDPVTTALVVGTRAAFTAVGGVLLGPAAADVAEVATRAVGAGLVTLRIVTSLSTTVAISSPRDHLEVGSQVHVSSANTPKPVYLPEAETGGFALTARPPKSANEIDLPSLRRVDALGDLARAASIGTTELARCASALLVDPVTTSGVRMQALRLLVDDEVRATLPGPEVAESVFQAAVLLFGDDADVRDARHLAIQWAGALLPTRDLHRLVRFLDAPWGAETWQAALQALQVIAEVDDPSASPHLEIARARVNLLLNKFADPDVASTTASAVMVGNLAVTALLLDDEEKMPWIVERLSTMHPRAQATVRRLLQRRLVNLEPSHRGSRRLTRAIGLLRSGGLSATATS